ncbi:MAG TPA: VWA domain-containing protein [Thermoanaerobaculia bacterium]|nr:VWA domain-containing protein [Thermoanaerobaculia bacterium]
MNRRRIALLTLAVGVAAGATRAVRAAEEPPRNESVTPAPMSKEEREWATEIVAPLLTADEKKLYLGLASPAERTSFRDEFWAIRERDGLRPPFGPGFKNLYTERLEAANEKYGGWKTDAGRIVLALGAPADVYTLDCPNDFRPIEIWTMEPATRMGTPEKLVFYRDFESGPLKLWSPILGPDVLLSPTISHQTPDAASGRRELESLYGARCGPQATMVTCKDECNVLWPVLISMEDRGDLGEALRVEKLAVFPPPPEGDWSRWRSRFVGSPAPTAVPAARAEPPAPASRKLSRADRKQLESKLPERYREWLDDVSLIITERERDVFLQVGDDVERDKFIEEFWRRRSVDKDGIRTNFREVFRARVEYAKEHFKNLGSDAAKVYILNGPPDALIPVNCPEVFVPIQIWYYERLEALKNKVYLVFYKAYGMGDWKLWLPIDGIQKLGLNSIAVDMREAEQSCFDAQNLQEAISYTTTILGPGISGMAEAEKMFARPPVETEGIDRFLGLTTQVSAAAAPLPIEKSVIFPEERDSKIACDVSLLLPRKDLALRDLGDQKFYDVDVVGEIVQNDRMLDNFKYRFDIPVDEVSGDQLPLTLRRYLYPGDYEIRVKAADANRKAEGRFAEALRVPEQPQAPPPVLAAAAAARKSEAPPADFRPSSISILPPVREILTGLQRFETKAAEGIVAVDFYLDGTKMLTRTKGPFQADLNLGPLPRRHEIRVVAYDAGGRSVGEDELHVNEGSESFRVKILSPRRGTNASGPTAVVADATAPEGRSIAKMEFYSNETKVATLYQPPWQQVVPFRKSGSLGYVRVVGTLDDGLVAEDVRYVNAPPYISEVNVDAVELYTTVTQGNRPVDGLTQANFQIFEDGKPQTVAQFEHVTNLPLTVGVAIDTSASMIENLPDAEKAALEFIDQTIGEKDRGFTMSFDDSPYTLCRLTGNRERLDRSFAGLRAEGSTALYDAIVYALYQFSGVKGKKALVVLTDGKDTTSKYDFDTLLDYVKKAGVAVYGIGLNVSKAELEVKSKLNRLAEASGGTTFYVDSTKSLKSVYQQINNELRTQYLLTYYSTNPNPDNKWRKVDVKVTPKNLTARTISGYYS